ncbi:hypothetical protein PM082_000283 [Marasmius tenuissimus]|nr:hypothetical protein PM082_000283 [Marasmius tenuissimus]
MIDHNRCNRNSVSPNHSSSSIQDGSPLIGFLKLCNVQAVDDRSEDSKEPLSSKRVETVVQGVIGPRTESVNVPLVAQFNGCHVRSRHPTEERKGKGASDTSKGH